MRTSSLSVGVFFLIVGLSNTSSATNDQPIQTAAVAADNTGRNERDRGGATKTPTDQSENEADRTVSQNIRQSIVADDSISTNGKNVKIITSDGVVTLRGPVKSNAEKTKIADTARRTAGVKKVDNQLEIAN